MLIHGDTKMGCLTLYSATETFFLEWSTINSRQNNSQQNLAAVFRVCCHTRHPPQAVHSPVERAIYLALPHHPRHLRHLHSIHALLVLALPTRQHLEADRIEFTDEDTALQCPCHLRTVIWLGDMDSFEGWWTAIRSVPHELPTTDLRNPLVPFCHECLSHSLAKLAKKA